MAKNRKLGRTSDIRKSMLRSLATEVIMYGKLEDHTLHSHQHELVQLYKIHFQLVKKWNQ